jgi:hypothetical protein
MGRAIFIELETSGVGNFGFDHEITELMADQGAAIAITGEPACRCAVGILNTAVGIGGKETSGQFIEKIGEAFFLDALRCP